MKRPELQTADVTLLDVIDRVIDRGVVLSGDVTISVADVDLIYIGLRVLIAPVERLQELQAGRDSSRAEVACE
jgi:gas vesicle structural protein